MKNKILICIFLLIGCLSTSAQKQDDKNNNKSTGRENGAATNAFVEVYYPELKCNITNYNENSYNIVFDENANVKPEDFFTQFTKYFSFRAEDTWQLIRSEKDDIGITHYRFQQYYKGIKVMGGEMLLHAKDGFLKIANGNYYNNLTINNISAISEETAIQKAMQYVGAEKWIWENPDAEKFLKETTEDSTASFVPKAELMISPVNGIYNIKSFRLSYKINIAAEKPYAIYDVFVDANSGDVINKISQIQDANATGTASTLYSGSKTVTTDYYGGKYRLRENVNGREIETYDMKQGSSLSNAVDYFDNDNTWDAVTVLKKVVINTVNSNWMIGGGEFFGTPDIFVQIKDASNNVVYTTKTIDNTFPAVTFNMFVILNNPPYKIIVWDEDFSNNDFLGSFNTDALVGTEILDSNGTNIKIEKYTESNPALDVHWGMEQVYEFYKTQLGRNSFDGAGAKIKNFLNADRSFANVGLPLNSCFLPSYGVFIFGYGYGAYSNPMVSLDVTGHEFTHAVVKFNGNGGLVYQNESGALNESFADIFGTAIEFFAKPLSANWLLGEDYWLLGGTHVRSMQNPHDAPYIPGTIDWRQPDTYNGLYWQFGSDDDGGVHKNNSIQNFWFYLLSHGGSDLSPNDLGNSYNVTAVGIDHATKIAYRNLVYYLTQNANYLNAVYGSKNAAMDLYGAGSQEETSVLNAWYAVGLYNNPNTYCSGIVNYTNNSGSFDDGSGNTNYQNNADCKWLITPNGASSITLTFNSFTTEATNDKVIVYDGATITDPILGTFSGSTVPASLTSTGSAMLVRFITNASTVQSGWSASYTSVVSSTCSGQTNLTSATGSFSDGSSGSNYTNNANCKWLIAPSGATSITLTFSAFDLLTGDTVRVYDGNSITSPLLNKYSGSSLPSNQTYSSTQILVQLVSDNTGNAAGFNASYTSTGSGFCSPSNNLTAAADTFSDGSGVLNYYNHTDCEWLIHPTSATSITLVFDSFALELPAQGGYGSIYDWVKVYDGPNSSSNLLGTFSGVTLPPSITSSGGNLFIQFHTDGATVAQGWTAHYTSTNVGYCSGTTNLTSASGNFTDGSGINNYINDADCRWLINPANAASIVLNFSSFNTEQGYDGVIIYDGPTINYPVIATFSGSNIPPQINSSGGSMLVRFMTDGATTAQGWEANYYANISSSGENSSSLYEYWFDDDYNNRVITQVVPVSVLTLNSNLSTNGLPVGLHTFNIRFRDKSGFWSSVVSQYFYKNLETPSHIKITQYEYWFDGDYQSKVLTSISPIQTFNLATSFNISNIPVGLHTLNIRFRDNAGFWSSVISQYFYRNQINNGLVNIAAYRYWFDASNANIIKVELPTPINPLNLVTFINTCNLPIGSHTVNFQFLDQAGFWSSVLSSSFTKGSQNYPLITLNGSSTICIGDSVLISAPAASSYLWNTGETTQNIFVSNPGDYWANVDYGFGCVLSSIDSISISNYSAHNGLSIIQNNDSLISPYSPPNYWYVTGNPIPIDSGNYHICTQPDLLFVVGNDINGCSAISDTTYFDCLFTSSNNMPISSEVLIYPNPTNGNSTVYYYLPTNALVNIKVYDALGVVKFSVAENTVESGANYHLIESSKMPNGVYYVSLMFNKQNIIRKLVVLK